MASSSKSKSDKSAINEEIAGSSSVSYVDSKTSLTITNVGAIKVSSPKKTPHRKSISSKPKAKRPKLDLVASSPNDDSITMDSDHEAETNFEDEEKADATEISKTRGNFALEEKTMQTSWDNGDYTSITGKSVITTAFDEIALEGLDGITLEALWTRLAVCFSITKPIPRSLMEFIWNNVIRDKTIKAYQLDSPRGTLKESVDGHFDDEIYPYVPINNVDNDEIGSCSTYYERKPIQVLEFSLKDAETMGNCLVLVASQELRNASLVNLVADPRLVDIQHVLIPPQYYILEKVGRSRRQGEITAGPGSISDIVKEPKTIFYHRNRMQVMKLLAKQGYHARSEKNVNHTTSLIHLHRFYNEVKTKRQLIIEYIIKMIKKKPACRIDFLELRRTLGNDIWEKYQLSKAIKSQEFRQFVKPDMMVPYRVMYPNASIAEWKHKGNNKEKIVRIFELSNPNLNINSIFKADRDDTDGKDSSDSESENDAHFGVMSVQRVYQAICDSGAEGIKLRKIGYRANTDHLTARNICKNLEQLGVIYHTLHDSKRQHYIIYKASEYKEGSEIDQNAQATPNIDEEADDNMEVDNSTYDFIGNVLGVDSSVIKINNNADSQQLEVAPTPSDYNIINELQRVHQNLNIYFTNEHPFEECAVRILKQVEDNKTTECTKTKQLFSALIQSSIEVESTAADSSFIPTCSYDIVASNCEHYKAYRIKGRPVKRSLKSFNPFKCLLNAKHNIKAIEHYQSIHESIQDSLSSNDDESLEEFNSTESIMSGLPSTSITPKDDVLKNVKTIIIEHFELENVHFRDMLSTQTEPSSLVVSQPVVLPPKETITKENFFNVDMEMFMGPKPRILSVSKDAYDVETMLVLSSAPEDFTNWRPMVTNSQRVQSRIQLIKNSVRNQKTVVDLIKLQSIVNETERAEGYDAKADRKSLYRIFTTLIKEGDLIIIKIILKYHNVIRFKSVLAEKQVDIETLIQSMVEQFKNSFVMYAKRKLFEEEENEAGPTNQIRRRFKYNKFIGKIYGTSPKVTKMRLMHEFLFYLIREYTGSPITRNEARNALLNHCDVESIDDVMNEATTLYQREASWRMFVQPLPKHRSWPDGWALISDIFLRLPLSLFVRLYNVTYIIPELPSYLNHPIRKHFIVKNLPSPIKDALLGYRKYIFSLYQVICHLAYIGLVQLGPQKLHHKDQVFVYLNKKAILYDTLSSETGYHQITPKEYPVMEYEFNTAADVEKYWSDLYYYAINTKLGLRGSVIGQSIKVEFVDGKPLLAATLKAQTPESAAKNDIGYLPGDQLGACCTDSALWIHVQKNWNWNSRTTRNNSSNLQIMNNIRRKHLDDLKPVTMSDMQARRGKKIKMCAARHSGNLARLKKSRVKIQARPSRKNSAILRKVKPRKLMKKARIRLDLIDKKIAEKMGKARAIFTAEEDKLVLVCMICIDYLTAFNRKRTVGTMAVRDFIHRTLPHVSKKTSLAYKRRTFHLRKRNNFDHADHKDGLHKKIFSDFLTEKHFGKLRNDLKNRTETIVNDAQLNMAFIYLAHYAWNRYKSYTSKETRQDNDELVIDYLKPGKIDRYRMDSASQDNFYKDPKTEDDVTLDTVQSVIHSSLGGFDKDDQQWPFLLLKVYQAFTDAIIRTALINMRDYQIIAGKKLKYGQEGTILMSGITYNLSFNYTFKQITQFPNCIFTEAHDIFMTMFKRFDLVKSSGFLFEKFEHGHWLAIGEFQTCRNIHWNFEFPDEIITLNPNMSDFSELIQELTQRYTELMKKTQESEDYDPEVIKQLESTLNSYIQEQGQTSVKQPPKSVPTSDTASKDQIKSDAQATPLDAKQETTSDSNDASPTSSDLLIETLNVDAEFARDSEDSGNKIAKLADFVNFGKADRRHRMWRISDMAFMLTKGLFPELDDDERLEKLNEHFIVRYPTCRIRFDESQTNDDVIFTNWQEEVVALSDGIQQKVLNDVLIKNIQLGQDEYNLEPEAEELASFIYSKGMIGASSDEIKEKFPGIIIKHLDHLIAVGLVLRAGVCTHLFVHNNYRHNWSIHLNNENLAKDNTLGCSYRIRISPWIRINGTVDDKALDKWLTIILSHCLSYPCITFPRLCARFNIIKPVDIYYLLEILQRLKCLRIWTYVHDDMDQDIFHDFSLPTQVPSSMLDDFDDVFVETESSVITKFGAFLNRSKTDFAYAFEEEE